MDGEAVKQIAALEDKSKTITVDGQVFARSDFKKVMYAPRPLPICGKTLTGLIDYIKANKEKIDLDPCMIQVVDHENVSLFGSFDGEDKGRTKYFIATLDKNLTVFPFGHYMAVEDFIIKSRALFQHSMDLETVIGIVSKVVQQGEITAADDGLSQTVQIKKGVTGAVSQGINTKGIYDLKPYRTFRELDQPSSKFILRLKAIEGSLPQVALYDAEGESWRSDAMQSIKKYLEGCDLSIPVIA